MALCPAHAKLLVDKGKMLFAGVQLGRAYESFSTPSKNFMATAMSWRLCFRHGQDSAFPAKVAGYEHVMILLCCI